MQAERLNRILLVLIVLYALYIALVLLWERLRDVLRNERRRDVGLLGFRIRRKPFR
ncbi:MAG TPA: hypothetical protein VFA39_09395 [Steroidobacteraceae bacterium]|nr:hypothetical protein [Steroidobacteraceae bacterium]